MYILSITSLFPEQNPSSQAKYIFMLASWLRIYCLHSLHASQVWLWYAWHFRFLFSSMGGCVKIRSVWVLCDFLLGKNIQAQESLGEKMLCVRTRKKQDIFGLWGMLAFLPVYLCICMSVCLPVCMCVCFSLYWLLPCLTTYLPASLPTYLPLYLTICLST